MIIGDPCIFSISLEIVNEWNIDNSFNNGILFLYVNGRVFPKRIISTTLNTEVYELTQNLQNVRINTDIFQMKKNDAFIRIYKLVFSENYVTENDYSYDVTPFALADDNCFVFMVSNGQEIRILATQLQYLVEESVHSLKNLEIEEAYISVEKMHEILEVINAFRNA